MTSRRRGHGEVHPSTGQIERDRWAEEVFSALGHLDRTDAEVVRLVYLTRLTCREVARRLGLTDAAVTTRLARGLRDVCEYLTESHLATP